MKRLIVLLSLALVSPLGACLYGHDFTGPGVVSWHLSVGAGRQTHSGVDFGVLAGGQLSLGVGGHHCIGIAPSYFGIIEKGNSGGSYLINLPLVLTAKFHAFKRLPMAVECGVGTGFSDMKEWTKSNRALTGFVSLAVFLRDSSASALAFESRLFKASTSTGNVTLIFGLLRYTIGL